jgi:nucleoside recognition membrane protein YjiH
MNRLQTVLELIVLVCLIALLIVAAQRINRPPASAVLDRHYNNGLFGHTSSAQPHLARVGHLVVGAIRK